MNNDSIDWSNRWSYPLQWLQESVFARWQYQLLIHRVNLAMEGRPWKNTYKEEMDSNLEKMTKDNQQKCKKYCKNIPEGQSHNLYQAVETIANQMASGVDTYECEINDPYMIQQPDTADKLAAMCQQDYIENDLGLFSSLYSRDLTRYGMVAVMVKYCPKKERNEIYRIHPKNTWWDTMYNSTGHERFRGYSTMISWKRLKKMVEDDGDEINTEIEAPNESIFDDKGKPKKIEKATYRYRKIRTLNGLDIYVSDINKLAASSQLQGGDFTWWEYTHDVADCYNLGYYRSWATDPKALTKSGYNGQDVELTVLYDLSRGIEFKIINRRFVISRNKKVFKRNILLNIYNPLSNKNTQKLTEVHLKCPLQFRFAHLDTMDKFSFPTSPLFTLLDAHDKLCGWRAKREHVSQILSILRLSTNGADADSLRGVLNIMGIVLDDIQGDIQSLNFQYAYDPIDSQIAHYEDTIQRTLSAYTQFDAMQAMGDRASAAESGMAIGAIAQGLSSHQNTIMALYADIARQCIMNRVVYSNLGEFSVVNQGGSSNLTIQEMALLTLVDVKSKFAQKVNETKEADRALSLLGMFKDRLSDSMLAYYMKKAMLGTAPRGLAESFVHPETNPQETALAMQQAQNQAEMLKQNQAMYEQNPLPYEADNTMRNNSEEDVDQIIASLQTPNGTEEIAETEIDQFGTPTQLDMQAQEGALALNIPVQTSDMGSAMANPNSML